MELTDNDRKLLAFCLNLPRTIGQIARHLKIATSSVSIRVRKLEVSNYVTIKKSGKGTKTFVRTVEGIKVKEYMKNILNEIIRRGGTVSENEFFISIMPINDDDPAQHDKSMALWSVWYNSLIDKNVSVNKRGEEFLKEVIDGKT